MGKVIRFEIRKDSLGVYCPPLRIHFPILLRALVTLNEEHIAEVFGDRPRPTGVVPGRAVHYTLDEEAQSLVGDVVWSPASTLLETDEASLFVRHHPSVAVARGYALALTDLGCAGSEPTIFSTDQGVFSLAHRKSLPRWPGPLLVYAAEHVNAEFGEIDWTLAFAPNGAIVDPDLVWGSS